MHAAEVACKDLHLAAGMRLQHTYRHLALCIHHPLPPTWTLYMLHPRLAGEFKQGAMEGVGAIVSGSARFQGHWSGGLCDGLGKAAFNDGSMYDG